MHMHRQGKFTLSLLPSHAEPQQKQPFLLPKELAEVICGAIGEIVQVAVLYPLDTVKVSSNHTHLHLCLLYRSM